MTNSSQLFWLGIPTIAGGIWLLGATSVNLRYRRWAAACLEGVFGGALIVLGGLLTILGLETLPYTVVDSSAARLELHFEKRGRQDYLALVRPADDRNDQTFSLRGDEWRLDINCIQWGPLSALGLKPAYRPAVLRSRYNELDTMPSTPPSTHYLTDPIQGKLWRIITFAQTYLPLWQAKTLELNYWPMAPGATFVLNPTADGAEIQPLNEQAKQVIDSSSMRTE